jgi:hypothetical protein
MKKYNFIAVVFSLLFIIACNKSKNHNLDSSKSELNSLTPSNSSTSSRPCPTCQNYPCVTNGTQMERINNGQDTLDRAKAYKFEDFLYDSTSTKKTSYHSYYYSLSAYAMANNLITATSLTDWYNFLNLGITCSNRLLTGSESTIVITDSDYNAFMFFYNSYKSSFNDSTLQSYIEILKNDLISSKGKTKTEVLALLN